VILSNRPPLHTQYLAKPSYTFLQTIGEGTAGICRLHRNDVLGIMVVSKTISLFGIPGGIARSEPWLLERLDHDRLVKVREAQWTPGMDPSLKSVTFTTDYCEGRSVSYALDEGYKFSINQALTITADVLDALAYLHEDQRLLHRDIKPGNVMLAEGRHRALIGDFGSAALLDAQGRAPAGAGTPLYLPPEAASGSLDQRADLYGAGMVLLEMFNGPLPYDHLDRIARDKIDERSAQGRRSLPDKFFMPAPWVPRKAAMQVRSLCATDLNDRPVSAAVALREIRDAQCVDWRRADGDGVTGCWRGQWPPNRPVAARREFEVTVELIERGPYRGKLLLRAAWRKPPSYVWRRYAKLETRIDANDVGALRRFFRAVEAEAQAAPTP
jgi:serine/threonine protein kinase